MPRFKAKLAGFLRESDGSSTIEFLMWLPLLTFVIALGADVALYFGYKATILRIVDDANRAASIGRLTTATATKNFIIGKLGGFSSVATVTVTVSNGIVVSTVTIPTKDVTATAVLSTFNVKNLYVVGQHLLET